MSVKVSVVVPIYNVENYLEECVESIRNQTLKEIEIILVDDGSPDNCPKMCDEFAEKDVRIRVVHQQNGGLSSAYNKGIELATGETIAFVESDDWIETDMYEKLYALYKKHNSDIIKCDFYRYNQFETPSSTPYPHGTANLKDIYAEDTPFRIEQAPLLLAYHSSVWAGLYKADFLKKLRFDEAKGAGYIDFPFGFKSLLLADKIVLTYNRFNHYRMEEGQNSSTKKPGRSAFKMIDQILKVKEDLEKQNLLDKYAEEFYYHASKCCCGFFYNSVPKEFKDEFYMYMRSVYKGLPKDFSYKYFEDGLKLFAQLLIQNEKAKIFGKKPKTLKQKIVRFISAVIPVKKYRKQFRHRFS